MILPLFSFLFLPVPSSFFCSPRSPRPRCLRSAGGSSSLFLAFESSLISSALSLEVVECIGMEPLRRFFRVCAELVTKKPKHVHLRGSAKLISTIMIARIVSLYFAIPRRISLYVPARLMGKSIAQVSTKFFCSWGCTQLDAACSWHWHAACSSSVAAKNAPQASGHLSALFVCFALCLFRLYPHVAFGSPCELDGSFSLV